MRSLLSTGIKAILAVAALSTAAHWTMRVQREPEASPAAQGPAMAPATTPAMAAIPDPVTTGSITPRKVERGAPPVLAEPAVGLDQQHLSKLFAGATEKPKAVKALAKR